MVLGRYRRPMDVSATDVLIWILLVNSAICAGYGYRSWRRRRAVIAAVNRERARMDDLPPRTPKPAAMPEAVPDAVPVTTPADAVIVEPAAPVVPQQLGRHREIEELMRASTYRLSADRLARAKVPETSRGEKQEAS